MHRIKYEDSLFTVRLAGEGLAEHGAGIYDVSVVLLSMQRIVHKAFLAMNDRLQPGQAPKREERKTISLSIGERKHNSDAYGLVPLFTDPATQAIFAKVMEYVVLGISGYFSGDVLERIKKEKDPSKLMFIGSIHPEILNIVNRIDATGGVDSIQIGAPSVGDPIFADFGERQRDYVNSLIGTYFLGKRQKIKGNVYKFYPNMNMVTIRVPGGKKVDVSLNEADFQTIRYQTGTNPSVEFDGRPKYKLGVDPGSITDFVAESIKLIPAA